MDKREFREMLDAIKADVDEIEYAVFTEKYSKYILLADSIINKAEKIKGFLITMELAQEVDKKIRNS